MYHELIRSASFWEFLFSVDEELAEATHKQECPCGGRLHRARAWVGMRSLLARRCWPVDR